MGIKQTLEVINRMEADGIMDRYAIAGAVAAYNYVEPAVTEDLDILISFERLPKSGLIALTPILGYLQQKGYLEFRKEGLSIEGWSVQFLPVSDDLDAEALAQAEEVAIEINSIEDTVKSRVLRPQHIVAIALRTGRPKDSIRIVQFLEENAVDIAGLCDVIARHGLREAWQRFCHRTGIANPCDVQPAP